MLNNEIWLDVCRLPPDRGPCRGSFRKYYFDRNTLQCLELVYGGCRGNGNRFSSLEECQSLCLQRAEVAPPGNVTSDANSGKTKFLAYYSRNSVSLNDLFLDIYVTLCSLN